MSSSRLSLCTARRVCALGLAAALALAPLAGCAEGSATDAGGGAATTTSSGDAAPVTVTHATGEGTVTLLSASDLFSERDLGASYDASSATAIELSDAGSTVSGAGAVADGSTVTITAEGTYVVSGTLSDGRIVVDVADTEKVQLVLAGASVTSSGAAALYVRQADKVFLTLAEGTSNTLAATGAAAAEDENNLDGAVFSKDDLTVNGSGALSVSSAQGHGIVVKDDLTLVSGTLDVEAAGHAIQAKDSVAVADGSYTLDAGTDGIHCANDEDATLGNVYVAGGTLQITAASDGVDAGGVLQVDNGSLTVAAGDDGLHAEHDLAVNGGSVSVTASVEAVEGSTVSVTGGELALVASDDGINAAGEPAADATDAVAQPGNPTFGEMMEYDKTASVLISGGTIVIDASGDGIDSNGDLTITGGETYVSGPTDGANGALDYTGTGTITGGVLVAAGSVGMAQNLGEGSTQGTMLVSASGAAGETVTLADAAGTVLASFSPAKAFGCAVISAPGVETGQTYTLTCGSMTSEITMESTVYSNVAGGFMGGTVLSGGPGGMGGAAPGAMGGAVPGSGAPDGGTPPEPA